MRFHRRISASVDFASLDGLYFGFPYHLSTLCTSPVIGRITAPERTIRSLAGYGLLESIWGPRPAGWLQSGLSRAMANCDDPRGLARLNRKMVASLAAGTVMSTEIFTFTPRDLGRLMQRSKDPRNSQKQQQFLDQAWSIVEYLAGEEAPHDLRKSLGAFMRDPRAKTNQEDSFQLHFGTSFGPSLEGWRQWVVDRGIGTYDAPPPKIRDGLLHRVLPIIRDRQAKRGDRLLAIREWANLGFALGADALIDLLRDSGDIPREEIVWALAMVSGMALGDNPDRWQSWWGERQSMLDEPVIGATLAEARMGPPGG